MTVPRLKRNRYELDGGDNPPHDSLHHAEDLQDFHLPLAQLHQAGLHASGVLDGLQVRGTPGAAQLIVEAGIALDGTGRLVVLGTSGWGDVRTEPGDAPHERTVPVTLPVPAAGGWHCVTVQFAEVLRANEGAGGRIEQVPWLRVHPAATFVDDGTAIVLAVVELTTNPAAPLKILAAAHDAVTAARRQVGRRVGELALATGHTDPNGVGDAISGRIRGRPAGGLALSVPAADDVITLAREDSGNFARLDVHATDTRITGTLNVAEALAVTGPTTLTGALTTAGSVQVGLTPVAGVTISPTDTTPNAGFVRFGDGTGWRLHFGRRREGVSGPPNTGLTGVFTTIQDNGAVGVGTVRPSARLSVTEQGATEIAGLAMSATLRTSAGPLGAAVGSEVALASFGLVADNANNVSLGVRAIRVATGPPGWPSMALGLGMDVDNTARAGGAGLLLHHDNKVEVRGKLTVGADIEVTRGLTVGPLAIPHAQGRLMVTGSTAELCFARRTLTAWPANPQAGDRYVWYNQSGTAALYTDPTGDVLRVNTDGDLSLRGSLSCFRADQPLMFIYESGTNNPERPVIAHSPGFTDWGLNYRDSDDTFIFKGSGAAVMSVFLSTRIVHINNLQQGSSREIKQGIAELSADEALTLLRGLNAVRFEYTDDDSHTTHLGFVSEDTPDLLTSADKKAVRPFGVIALLSRVVQTQHAQIADLRAELEVLRGRP